MNECLTRYITHPDHTLSPTREQVSIHPKHSCLCSFSRMHQIIVEMIGFIYPSSARVKIIKKIFNSYLIKTNPTSCTLDRNPPPGLKIPAAPELVVSESNLSAMIEMESVGYWD
jgi:hypothetical protein